MKKLFRISTVSTSLNILLKGQLRFLNQFYNVTAIYGAGNNLFEVKNREGVKTRGIEMQRQISPLKDMVSMLDDFQSRLGFELGKKTAWFSGKRRRTVNSQKINSGKPIISTKYCIYH